MGRIISQGSFHRGTIGRSAYTQGNSHPETNDNNRKLLQNRHDKLHSDIAANHAESGVMKEPDQSSIYQTDHNKWRRDGNCKNGSLLPALNGSFVHGHKGGHEAELSTCDKVQNHTNLGFDIGVCEAFFGHIGCDTHNADDHGNSDEKTESNEDEFGEGDFSCFLLNGKVSWSS